MKFKSLWTLFSFLIYSLDVCHSGTITDCFFINNNTESVHLICEETKEPYPKMECHSQFFEDTAWQTNREKLKLLSVSSCRGSGLNANFISTFKNLRAFDTSYFGLQYLTPEALNLRYLEKMNASHNKLTEIQSSNFKNTPNLSDIDFSFNKISKLSANTFENVPKMRTVNVSNNMISTIESKAFWQLSELEILDLSNNSIQTINDDLLKNNKKLNVLNLENNPIKQIKCSVLWSMISVNGALIDITLNHLEEFDSSCMKNALQIAIDPEENGIIFRASNRSSRLRFAKEDLKHLKFVNISGNQLQNARNVIKLLGPSIEKMDVSSNVIGKMDSQTFKTFNNLQYLNLSRTNLSNFGFHTFYHQNKLQVLDISYNRLGKVDFSLLFRNFKNLNTLNLEGNDLVNIDSVTRSNFPKLSFLGISKNKFSCQYLATFLRLWEDLNIFHNPTADQTHIDGVDCVHDGQDTDLIEENEGNKIEIEVTTDTETSGTTEEIETTNESDPSETTADTSMDFISTEIQNTSEETAIPNTESDQFSTESNNFSNIEKRKQLSQPSVAPTNYNLIEMRVIECVLILMCGYFVIKTKAIQRINKKLKRISLERNVTYRQSERGSQNAIVLIDPENVGGDSKLSTAI